MATEECADATDKTETNAIELQTQINIFGHTQHADTLALISKIHQTTIKNNPPSNK